MAFLSAVFSAGVDLPSKARQESLANVVNLAASDFLPVCRFSAWAWCHADLFEAGFPEARGRPGMAIMALVARLLYHG